MSKYLDKVGLEHYHDLIKDGLYEYIEGTQASATSTWTGVSTQPSLSSGKLIIYHLPYAGGSAVPTLNLTLPDSTTTGAKTVGSKAGTFYSAGDYIPLVYNGTSWGVVDGLNIDGAITSVVKNNLTASRALVSDANGKIAVSNTTANDLVNVQKNNLLSDATAEFLGLTNTAVPNDAFQVLGERQKAVLRFESIETSGTWTVPSNLYGGKIFVICVGGGGSGGTSHASNSYAGGGGGSGHIAFGNISVTPGQTLTAVIGAGGAARTSYGYAGNNGGATTFGGLTANGGSGGDKHATDGSHKGGYGGAGGGGSYDGGGGNGSFGGGGAGAAGKAGGNGGTYGGGGSSYSGTPGTGGTYGGSGGSTSVSCQSGSEYQNSFELWDIAAEYYGVTKVNYFFYHNNDNYTGFQRTGGGGLGYWFNSSATYSGGCGFLASGQAFSASMYGGGGGLFYSPMNVKTTGAGGFYSAGDSLLRGAGGGVTNGTTSIAGGSGVVAIWYYITPTHYFNENI